MGDRESVSGVYARSGLQHEGGRFPFLGLAGMLLLAGMAAAFWIWPTSQNETAQESLPARGPDWAVTFTDPSIGPDNASAAEKQVIEAIEGAESQIDLAMYSFTLATVREALLSAHARGVQVRMVMESDNLYTAEVAALQGAGIAIRSDERGHLMHHKFMVIDRRLVWAGSMNFTFSGARRDNNNGILIENRELAEDMLVEFEEMHLEDRFGRLSQRNTPYELIQIDGRVVEVLFAPDDRITQRLVQIVRGAQRNIQVLAFILTSDPFAAALAERSQAGIPVQLVLEAGNADAPGSDYLALLEAGIDLRLDSNPYNMHHKVVIIDDRIVALGSFNYTRSAEQANDESLLVIHNPEVVQAYRGEFERLYDGALP